MTHIPMKRKVFMDSILPFHGIFISHENMESMKTLRFIGIMGHEIYQNATFMGSFMAYQKKQGGFISFSLKFHS